MMKRTIMLAATLSLVAVLATGFAVQPFTAGATVPGNNTRVSLTGAGAQSSMDSTAGGISRDGRFVVFENAQNNFVGTDTNGKTDVFVRELSSGTVTRVSLSTSGVAPNNGVSRPVISETGRYVVYVSAASNLIDGQTVTTSHLQMYVRDTLAGTTTLLTEISPGTYANNHMTPLDVSNDGRFVLFMTQATNLGPTVPSGYDNVFLLDRDTSTISWVNAQGAGITYGNSVRNAQMSCDGSFIVFDSNADYLGLPYSSHVDVFLLDRRGGNKLTNLTGSANGAAMKPEISCSGNYIGFVSNAYNLDPAFTSAGGYRAYMYNRISNQYKLLDQTSGGSLANATVMNTTADPFYLTLSDKGTAVFGSTATNLDAAATAGYRQLYFRNPAAGTTELLTRDSGGTESDASNPAQTLVIDLEGKLVAYDSTATNLVSGDTNAKRDLFVSETGF